ncbi:MAG TPA: selenide, water dikinase SelD [Thermoanaerobaculia bacterium]|nr:selenide, water dikinase SelD [Thermoanaerobaculia bacterium]
MPSSRLPELVLVGGGHTHVQVLRSLAMEPVPARLTVVLDTPVAIYSGMTPGLVAGDYRASELEIDVVPLARLARARVVLAAAVGVEPHHRRILLEGRPPLAYDVASFDIGSTVAQADLPGVREHAIPTRPISALVHRVDEVVDAARAHRAERAFRVVVVGAGAGGVELAFTLEHRLRCVTGRPPEVLMIHASERPMSSYPERLSRRIASRARERGIVVERATVKAVAGGAVQLDDGSTRPFDALVWVTGAIAHPVFESSGLQLDGRGFVLIRPTLQVLGHDELFAAGDCASLASDPSPKAGVYAVRQGPYLTHNLRALLDGRPLRRYRPQSDFLTLLNLGGGAALGTKWGLVFEGRWVMRLKDRIDRAFMRRFQALDETGARTPELAPLEMEDAEPMECGGCAAKLDAPALERALARLPAAAADPAAEVGLARADDAALWVSPGGDRIAVSIDAFRSFTDDPWLVGRVAALNALSDLDAKGVAARFAQALVTLPAGLAGPPGEELLFQVLSGIRLELDRLGVTLLGGHTTTGPELAVGLAVEGALDRDAGWLGIDSLAPGLDLVLGKALGTGVLFYADMRGRLRGPWLESALASMLLPNREAARLARAHRVRAATDVSGFGLLAHLGEMVRASGVLAELDTATLPALPGALELLRSDLRSTAHAQNLAARRWLRAGPEPHHTPVEVEALLFDPQPAGGLLLGVPADRSAALVEALREAGYAAAARIGRVVPGELPGVRLVSSAASAGTPAGSSPAAAVAAAS